MKQRLQKHEEFMMKEERELFRTSSLTARKQHASTQSESELETSTKRLISRRFNSNKFLFDMSTESSKMTMIDSFEQEQDESLRTEQAQEKESRSQKDSRSMSSSSNMTSQQQFEFQMMNIKLKMMRLEAQKLECQKKLT